MDLNREIGERIIRLRKRQNLSRRALAKQLGISHAHLGMIERGERGLTIEKCILLSSTCSVSIDYIVTGDSYPPRPTDKHLPSNTTTFGWIEIAEFILSEAKASL